MNSMRPSSSHRRAALMMTCSAFCFALMAAMIKAVAAYPLPQIIFFRCFFALVVIVLMLRWRGELTQIQTARFGAHLIRALCGMLAMFCIFQGYRSLPLAEVSALRFSAPLFLAILAAPILKERTLRNRWWGIFIGLIGVLLILRPDAGTLGDPASLLVLFGAFASSLAMISIRSLGKTESKLLIVFYFMAISSSLTFFSLPLLWVTPSTLDLLLLVGSGVLGAIGQVFMVDAYQSAEASFVAPFDYLSLVWSAVLDYVIWSKLLGPTVLIGASIVIVSNLLLLQSEIRRQTLALRN